MILTPPQPELKADWQKEFQDAGRTSRYPVIRLQVEKLGRVQ